VRELRNTVERLVILAPAGSVRGEDVAGLTGPPVGRTREDATAALLDRNLSFSDYRDAAEKAFLERKLLENDWNVSETARQLDMQRSHLYKKIEKYRLSREETARST
jgi:two-component system nitrogen regulation response regulator NtrX